MSTVHIWMATDPATRRVAAQSHEFGHGDFPAGPDGAGWPIREADIDEDVWNAVLTAALPPAEQDRLHRSWWDAAGREGDPLWPELSHD